MPTYDYRCAGCGARWTAVRSIEGRDDPVGCDCGDVFVRQVSAVAFKFAGRVVQGGGPDRFTADVLGISLRDLPEGLKAEKT